MSLYERSADIPLVPCTICSGKHRPEAVAVSLDYGPERYIAGTVTCPVGRSADEWYAAGDQPRLARMDERAARTANWFSVPTPPPPPIPRGEPSLARDDTRVCRSWWGGRSA